MKLFIAIVMMIGGVLIGLYVGLYLMFICGIVSLVDCIKHSDTATGMQWAWSIARIFPLPQLLGWCTAMALIVPGYALLKSK